jgi:hypothetical protein
MEYDPYKKPVLINYTEKTILINDHAISLSITPA